MPPAAPDGYEEFFRSSFRELVRAAMYAGATLQEAEDAADKTLTEMLRRWGTNKQPLAYARKATVHNFIKDKTRGTSRVARRLIERGYQLTAWEDEEWVAYVLSSLPSAQHEVMELTAQGLDRDEIAKTLGKTRETIRRILCDARARLSRELNPAGERRQDPARQRRLQPSRRVARAQVGGPMTTNGDMTPRQPHEYEPLEQLPGDSFDLVDLVVAGITDAEVDDHLRKVLSGESPSTPRPRRLRWRQLSRH